MVIKPFCRRYYPATSTSTASLGQPEGHLYVAIEGNAGVF
jgi:hypothetical protein